MGYLVAIVVSLILFAGFLALTRYETRRGSRLFASDRVRFDARVERAEFVLAHVDFASLIRTETERLINRAGHDLTHGVLQAVRAAERLLTRAVRHLRARRESASLPPRETSREYVKKLSDFKGHLEATRPEDIGQPPV